MVDIHSHVLFGVDDGAIDIEESLQMLKAAEKAGVRAVVATPHLREHVLDPEKTYRNYNILAERMDDININMCLGFEIMLNPALEKAPDIISRHDMCGTGYLLVEIPYLNYMEQTLKMLDILIWQHNFKMIIAHPERLGSDIKSKKTVSRLKEMGFLIQVNTGSIVGFYGERTRNMVKHIVRNRMADFVASDAHRAINYSWYEQAYASVVKWSDESYAERLFRENGRMLLEGKRASCIASGKGDH